MDEKRAIAALGALAQETRLALFRLLVTVGPAGLPAGVIAERLRVQPSSLSFHLAQLVHAGLITQCRLSRQLIYSAEYSAMNALLAYLTENCCGRDTVSAPMCDPAVGCCSDATGKTTAA
jgi:ArsR family transcriptional regulator, arsenate/arsenite/antimonite-responsive transcriptional repressor